MTDLVEIFERPYEAEYKDWHAIPGFIIRRTSKDYTVIDLDLEADPAKRDPAWVERIMKGYTSLAKFKREMRRDWSSGSGDAYFPEFAVYGGRDFYVRSLPGILRNRPVLRGWDLGVKKPAVGWLQVDEVYRVAVFRSILPGYMPIHDLGQVVQFLSGQRSLGDCSPEFARPFLETYLQNPRNNPYPWFPPGAKFLDFAGHEKNMATDMQKTRDDPRTRTEVLSRLGIHLQHCHAAAKRDTIARQLLAPRPDGRPGIIFDPHNEQLITAFDGGMVWEPVTRLRPTPEKYLKDGENDDIFEAVFYAIVAAVPVTIPVEVFETVMSGRLITHKPVTANLGNYEAREQ